MKCLKITNDSEAGSACCPTKYIDDSLVNCSAEGVVCPPEGWTYEIDGADLITDNRACEKCGIDSPMYRHLCFDAQQALWSDHCLDTGDSQINAGVAPKPHDLVVKKGQNKLVDAYSSFMDNTKRINTELDSHLRAKGIKDLYVVGIATDVCVKETVLDAFNGNTQSYRVTVISDAMAAVLGNSDNHAAAVAAMEAGGATIKTVAEVLAEQTAQKMFALLQMTAATMAQPQTQTRRMVVCAAATVGLLALTAHHVILLRAMAVMTLMVIQRAWIRQHLLFSHWQHYSSHALLFEDHSFGRTLLILAWL